jgi:hypothetical protein
MIIQLSEYRAAPRQLRKTGTYGGHVVAKNALPAVVICMADRAPRTADFELPEEIAIADVHALLDRIYALATQI